MNNGHLFGSLFCAHILLLVACDPQNIERLRAGEACNNNFDCNIGLLCSHGVCSAVFDAGTPLDASFDVPRSDAYAETDAETDAETTTDTSVRPPDASVDTRSNDTTCVAATCQSLDVSCGTWDNNCNGSIDCGGCDTGSTCNPSGQCECVPKSCEALDVECGSVNNGCGATLNCGTCAAGSDCQNNSCIAIPSVDCSGISANSGFELCVQTTTMCAGVFLNSQGCNAFCAAAGLSCSARYGGELGCQKEPQNLLGCDDSNDHVTDWCECGSGGVVVVPPDPTCTTSPSNPPRQMEINYARATYNPRSSWVLQCRDYAYTAKYAEHEACDSLYQDGSGKGTASFYFDAPRGKYKVYLVGRHTENRNPAGALVRVRSDGQEWTGIVNQRDDGGVVADLVGTYCLGGSVEVMLDSTVNSESDSVQSVRLVPD